MLKIKLVRFGKKNQPFFRLVVMEKRSKVFGRYLENLGTYNPRLAKNKLKIDQKRYAYWLEKGAQPTLTVKSLAEK